MIKYSRLTNYKIRKIIGCFYLDLTASQSVYITGFNRNTINRFFNLRIPRPLGRGSYVFSRQVLWCGGYIGLFFILLFLYSY
jgi:hypothetical protein